MLPIVDEAREKVTDLMEDMVVKGLRDLVSVQLLRRKMGLVKLKD
jgi:hypothetical protein